MTKAGEKNEQTKDNYNKNGNNNYRRQANTKVVLPSAPFFPDD